MKNIWLLLFLLPSLLFLSARAQKPRFTIHNLSLPKEIEDYNNQFSGVYIHKNTLFFLSESRLQDGAEGKLYGITLPNLEHKLVDASFNLPYKKYLIYNLDIIRDKLSTADQSYEGLEAFIIEADTVYFSVETATPSTNCYMLKGHLSDTAVTLDTSFLLALPKPLASNGSHIYNAGFEAMARINRQVFAFYEFNYFPVKNVAYKYTSPISPGNSTLKVRPLKQIPFRLTDITNIGGNHLTAINYFYKGEGADTIYRPVKNDSLNKKLAKYKGSYRNYARLIKIDLAGEHFTWQPLWEFPAAYSDYNWEGIAAYKSGYFIINDKYTPKRPYTSTLLYLQKNEINNYSKVR